MNDVLNYLVWPMLANVGALGIVGAAGWYQFRRQHLHTMRMNLFSELMGKRFHITGDAFSAAMNRVLVLFHDDSKVVQACRNFAHAARDRKADKKELVAILRPLYHRLFSKKKSLTDDDFTTAFNLRSDGLIPVEISVRPATGGAHPEVVLFGARSSNPLTFATLDAAATQRLISDLQQNLKYAQAQSASA